jgi:hypothetical protein
LEDQKGESFVKKLLFIGPIVLGALFSHLPAFSQDEATKPGYKNGDTWLFTSKDSGTIGSDPSKMLNGTYELSIVDGKFKIAVVTGSQKDELDPRPPTLSCLLGYCPNLNFPLTVGKQWTRDYKGTYIGSSKTMARKVTYEVKGVENKSPLPQGRSVRLSWKVMTGPAPGTFGLPTTGTAPRLRA